MTNKVAVLLKAGKPVKTIHNIKSVVANKKYGYFEITERINQHDIITIHRFSDIDRVEIYKPDENYARLEKVPYMVVERG